MSRITSDSMSMDLENLMDLIFVLSGIKSFQKNLDLLMDLANLGQELR